MKTLLTIVLVILIVILALLATVGIARADSGPIPQLLTIIRFEDGSATYYLHAAGDCHAANATGEWPLNADPWCEVPQDETSQVKKHSTRSTDPSASNTPSPTLTTNPTSTPDPVSTPDPTSTPNPPPDSSKKTCTDVNSQGHVQCSSEHSNPNSGHEQNTNKGGKP